MNTAAAVNTMRSALGRGTLHVIAGTGVTAAATNGDPISSWPGLVKDAIGRCVEIGARDEQWATRARGDADSPFEGDIIAAAEKAVTALGGRNGAEYRTWLANTIGSIRAVDHELLASVGRLGEAGALITTTNYDTLIEDELGWESVTWRDPHIRDVLRGTRQAVVHIHGIWSDPQSTVFGASSYADILNDATAGQFMRSMIYTQTAVFVGFGSGLADPNFSALRLWMRDVLHDSGDHSFRLTQAADVPLQSAQHEGESIKVLTYGDNRSDLPAFLNRISSDAADRVAFRGVSSGSEHTESGHPAGPTDIPLPVRAPDEGDLAAITQVATKLQAVLAASGDPENSLPYAEVDPNHTDRFTAIFSEEIQVVIGAATHIADINAAEATQVAVWAKRLESILEAKPDE